MKYIQNYITRHTLALCLMLISGLSSYAQFDDANVYLRIYGSIADNDNNSSLGDCVVKVLKNGEFAEDYTTRKTGKYEFFLPAGYNYRFYFEKEGFVGKNIEISTLEAAKMEEQFIFSLKADISLFKNIDGMDYSVLDEPIGKGFCNGRKGKVQFDKEYTKNMESKIAQIYVPVEANTSQSTRVSIEETIIEVPEEDDVELTVDEIFVEAEMENELLALEEIDMSKLEIVSNETKVFALIDTPVEVAPIALVDEPIVTEEEELNNNKKAKEVMDEVKSSDVDNIIIPVKIVESEPYSDSPKNLVWKVQIGAFSTDKIEAFTDLSNVEFITDKNNITRCVVGSFNNPMDAAKEKIRLINAGYSDAFLAVYKGQERININDAGVNLSHISYTKIKEEINE